MYKYYTVYKVTNRVNDKYYIGMHRTNHLDDGYFGSGLAIKKAIKKYGIDCFQKEILFIFDNETDMIEKEKDIVRINNETYNMTIGGRGGFYYINENGVNLGDNNVMRRSEEARRKVSKSLKEKYKNPEFKERMRVSSTKNLEKTWISNKGKKRPEQSIVAREMSKKMWATKREEIRDKISATYRLTSPTGIVYTTNRLTEFCEKNNLTFTTVWGACRNNPGKPITKGRAKGWTGKLIIAP